MNDFRRRADNDAHADRNADDPTTTSLSPRMGFVTTRLPRARLQKIYLAVIAFAGPVTEAPRLVVR